MRKLIYFILSMILISSVTALHSNWDGPIPGYISQYLETSNKTINAQGDYSAGEEFIIQPPNNTFIRVARVMITIGDVGIGHADEYGALSELTNGVSFWTELNGVKSRIDGNLSIKNNGQYVKLMHDFNCDLASLANGIDYCTGRWTFDKSGTLLRLNGATSDKFIVMLNDSFEGLNEHFFLIQGYTELDTNTTNELLEDLNGGFNMIGIAILLIGFMFFILYTANKITTRDQAGNLVKINSYLQMILYGVAFFSAFFSVLLMAGSATAQNLNAAILNPLLNYYQFIMWVFIVLGAIFLLGITINTFWSFGIWATAQLKRK